MNTEVRPLFCVIAVQTLLMREKLKRREQNQRYYQRLKQDPERFRRVMKKAQESESSVDWEGVVPSSFQADQTVAESARPEEGTWDQAPDTAP